MVSATLEGGLGVKSSTHLKTQPINRVFDLNFAKQTFKGKVEGKTFLVLVPSGAPQQEIWVENVISTLSGGWAI